MAVAGIRMVTDPVLADAEVRYVGEPVAVVVAESRYAAEDAAESVQVEYDALPACVELERALSPESAIVHADSGTNLVGERSWETGDVAGAFLQADHVLEETFLAHRGTSSPLEGRGIVAVPGACPGGPYEIARVSLDSEGKATVHAGTAPQGQGHHTVHALERFGAKIDRFPVFPYHIVRLLRDTELSAH